MFPSHLFLRHCARLGVLRGARPDLEPKEEPQFNPIQGCRLLEDFFRFALKKHQRHHYRNELGQMDR